MKTTALRLGSSLAFALGLFLVPATSDAATISLNQILVNPSFEAGVGSSCPVSWTCSVPATVGTTSPTAAQYPAPNGLPSGFVPNGTVAAFAPVAGSSGVILSQTLAGQSYVGGNTYTFDFWIGNPLGGTFLGSGGSVDVYWLLNGTAVGNLCDTGGRVATLQIGAASYTDNSGACQFHLPTTTPTQTYLADDGKWLHYLLSLSVPTGLAGNLGIGLGLNFSGVGAGQGNGASVQLDVPGPTTLTPVPEPASLALLGFGLCGVGIGLRSRMKK